MEIRIYSFSRNRLIATPDVQAVPRAGEIVCGNDWNGQPFMGIVQSVKHELGNPDTIPIEVRIAE